MKVDTTNLQRKIKKATEARQKLRAELIEVNNTLANFRKKKEEYSIDKIRKRISKEL